MIQDALDRFLQGWAGYFAYGTPRPSFRRVVYDTAGRSAEADVKVCVGDGPCVPAEPVEVGQGLGWTLSFLHRSQRPHRVCYSLRRAARRLMRL